MVCPFLPASLPPCLPASPSGTSGRASRVDGLRLSLNRNISVNPNINGLALYSNVHPSGVRSNLTLWGGTFSAIRADVHLDTVKMLFPAANRRVLDEVGVTSAETLVNLDTGGSTGGSLRIPGLGFMLTISRVFLDTNALFTVIFVVAMLVAC